MDAALHVLSNVPFLDVLAVDVFDKGWKRICKMNHPTYRWISQNIIQAERGMGQKVDKELTLVIN